MNNELVQTIFNDALWLLVVVGWGLLLAIGIEADKPLSGGLPSHHELHAQQSPHVEGWWGRVGEKAAWTLFGLLLVSLPVILWWIFAVHPR